MMTLFEEEEEEDGVISADDDDNINDPLYFEENLNNRLADAINNSLVDN